MKWYLLGAAFLSTAFSTGLAAAEPTTAEAVIERYIEALGGREVMERFDSRQVEATFEQSGLTGELALYAADPDRYRMTLTLAGMGDFEEGVVDSIGWSMDPMSGPQLMQGGHLSATLLRARYNLELHYFDLYKAVALEGKVTFDGVPCHKLSLVAPSGTSFEFFEVETGLLRGSQGNHLLPGDQSVEMTSVIEGYAAYDDRLYPVKTVSTSPMGEQTIVVTGVTHGSVDPKVFALPDPVRALLENE